MTDEPEPGAPASYPSDDLVQLRSWRMTDLACVEAASSDGRIPQGTTVPSRFTPEAGRAWISRQHQRATDGKGWSLAIADAVTGQAVGCVALLLRPQPGVAGIGYWIVPRARGLGYASRAVDLAASWALDTVRLARVEAWVEPSNRASIAVVRRCGFESEGRLRSFLSFESQGESRRADALVFSRIRDD